MSQIPTDTQLLDFIIKEMEYREWMDMFPLFRPLYTFPDGSYEYTEKYIDRKTFKEHLISAYNRWEDMK